MKSIPWLNQNHSFDRSKSLLKTLNMGYSGEKFQNYQNSRKWGVVNKQVGEKANSALITSFISGLGIDYLNFIDDSQGKALGLLKKLFTAISSTFEGERDNLMYKHLYGMGIDKNLDPETELYNQEAAAESGKITAPDDWMENKLQEKLYGENVVAKLGELATRAAMIKPSANIISSLLPTEYKKLVDTIIDLPAKSWWRARFFGGSLHANFVTTAYNLVKDGIGSIFSNESGEAFARTKKELHTKSLEYFKAKGTNVTATNEDSPSLKLYFRMLTDRLAEHWNGIRNPEKVVNDKVAKGLLKEGEVDFQRQSLSSLTDFTGPFCAAFGLIGTVVFDPLSKIMGIAGIQTGKNLVNTLSSSRKFFQLANYIPRFILPEIFTGKKAEQFKDAVMGEGIKDEKREVERQLYHSYKAREKNGIFGLLVAALNMGEPFGHFFGVSSSENKAVKFMFDLFTRLGDTGFLMFFTQRRRYMGQEAFSLSLIRERDSLTGATDAKVNPQGINYSIEDLNRIAKETLDSTSVKIRSPHNIITDPLTQLTNNLKTAEVFDPAYAPKIQIA